ncbi:alpha/beta-hydrolase [Periconia macrospinosa]|uniref:Alpha/beta-hydrolase n=1 Tax=Periconia macrospinosa TaxID=97972 RepID=A0A2V1E2L6_9PLEO|nr:alpha/beta-hydrolase [Periconia macrospinosa]
MAITTPTSSYHTTTRGTKLHYLQTGNQTGPLLLCLHGLGGSTDTFNPLLPYLPSDYSTILVDFPGFGKSPLTASPNTISIANHVADLDDFITSLQGPSQPRGVVIIGHSMGAIVALQYAALRPETVKGLALLGAGRSAAGIPAAKQRMLDLAAAVREKGVAFAADLATKSNFYEPTPERKADPKAQEAVRNAVLAADPEAYARTCEALVDPEHKDPKYELIVAPAVFVAGDKDVISPVERSQGLRESIGGKSWVEVMKSGHQPILEDIEGVKSAINKLFESINST